METENKDWKPEVGGEVWIFRNASRLQGTRIQEDDGMGNYLLISYGEELNNNHGWHRQEWMFPTPEAALASIKVYDLDGKEVVVTRDLPVHVTAVCPRCSGKVDLDKETGGVLKRLANVASKMGFPYNSEGAARLYAAQERFASLASGDEDPADPSVREHTTPTDKRNGGHC